MSTVQKSVSKSSTKFVLEDIDSLMPPKSVKKGSSKGGAISEPRAVTTRAKSVASKRKRSSEPEGDSYDVERQLHEALTKGMARMRGFHEKSVKELEESLDDMRTIAAAKDKAIAKLTKEKNSLDHQLVDLETRIHEEVMEATEQAKIWVARSVFEARIKMAQEAGDPDFDKSAWDVAKWEQTLAALGDGDEEEPAGKVAEVGTH